MLLGLCYFTVSKAKFSLQCDKNYTRCNIFLITNNLQELNIKNKSLFPLVIASRMHESNGFPSTKKKKSDAQNFKIFQLRYYAKIVEWI